MQQREACDTFGKVTHVSATDFIQQVSAARCEVGGASGARGRVEGAGEVGGGGGRRWRGKNGSWPGRGGRGV